MAMHAKGAVSTAAFRLGSLLATSAIVRSKLALDRDAIMDAVRELVGLAKHPRHPSRAYGEWPSSLWHAGLCLVSLVNIYLCRRAIDAQRRDRPERSRYDRAMAALCVPMTCVCAFRSLFCEDYATRDVWYDSPLNSILLHRLLSVCSELSWIGQVALAFGAVGGDLPSGGAWFKRAAGFLWACIVVAECCSCAGTVTTDRLFFLGEEGSWVVGFTVFLPFALALARRIPGDDDSWKAARRFARVLAVCVCCYVPWGWLSDVPSNYEAWRKDQAAGKRYFGFWDGLEDAATTRRETRAWDAWGHKLLWMTAYFTLGVWSSIALVSAPRKRSDKRIPLLARELSVSIC